MNGTCNNKRFSLEEVLADESEFTTFLAERTWHKVKSNPSWKQFVNANCRLETVENQLQRINAKLDDIAVKLNKGGLHG